MAFVAEHAAKMKKMQEHEKRQKVEFRKRGYFKDLSGAELPFYSHPRFGPKASKDSRRRKHAQMEKEVTDFIQDTCQMKKKFRAMGKLERSILHDVVEVAGLASFSFGDDEESRYVMIFKKEFAPSDEELEAYRKGEEWDPQKAEEKRKLKELAQKEAEEDELRGPATVNPNSNYKDKYSHLIGKVAAKDAAHTLEANKAYGCVPVANKRDTRSIEVAMNEIRAKKRLKQSEEDTPGSSSS